MAEGLAQACCQHPHLLASAEESPCLTMYGVMEVPTTIARFDRHLLEAMYCQPSPPRDQLLSCASERFVLCDKAKAKRWPHLPAVATACPADPSATPHTRLGTCWCRVGPPVVCCRAQVSSPVGICKDVIVHQCVQSAAAKGGRSQ